MTVQHLSLMTLKTQELGAKVVFILDFMPSMSVCKLLTTTVVVCL